MVIQISSTGEIVLEQKTEGAPVVTIPVNHLHSGIYLLILTLNGETKASVKISLQ